MVYNHLDFIKIVYLPIKISLKIYFTHQELIQME